MLWTDNWHKTSRFHLLAWATTTAKSVLSPTYPNGHMCMCCTPRDKKKIWQKTNFRRTVYSFIWLMFSLNLRNVAQIQNYDECSKPKITASFVETNEHHEFTSEAKKSFKSCQNDKVYCLKKSICIQMLFHSIFFIFIWSQIIVTWH